MKNLVVPLLILFLFACAHKEKVILGSLTEETSRDVSSDANSFIKKCDVHFVTFVTTLGTIKMKLFTKESPIGTENFLKYVNSGFYNGQIFHRAYPKFVVQAGGRNAKLEEIKPLFPKIKNEADNMLSHVRGSVAYARDTALDTATMQFFINLVDNKFLDHTSENFGYAIFAQVIQGMNIVDKISKLETKKVVDIDNNPETPDDGEFDHIPVRSVIIKKAFSTCQ